MRRDFYATYFELEDRHWWFVGRRKVVLRTLDRYLPPAPEGRRRRILDLGCGTGTMLGYLAGYGDAEGADADEDAIRFCRARGVTRVRVVESGRLPYPDASFDLVTALDMLEHIEDDRGTLREIRRILRPAGSLLVSVPAYPFLWGPQDEISHHKRRYRARALVEGARGAGLDVVRHSYFNSILFPPIAAIRLLRPYRPGSPHLRSDFEMTKLGRFNDLLARIFSLEAALVERVSLPVGVSILMLAERPTRSKHELAPVSALQSPARTDGDFE